MKITKTSLDALPLPASGQKLIYDDDLKGFGVRLTPGSKTYFVQGRVNNQSRRISLGKHGVITADKARDKAKKVLAGFIDGVDPVIEKKRSEVLSVTLRMVADEYIELRDDKLRQSSIDSINKHINKSFAAWAKRPVIDINRDMVVAKHKELSRASKAQADLAFRVLRALLNFASAKYRPDGKPLFSENPVSVLDKSQLNLWHQVQARKVFIPHDKIGIAWNCLQDLRNHPVQTMSSRTNADLLCFLLLTGARWSEGAELTWDRVNLEERWFHLPDPKNRTPATIPLSKVVCEILEARPRINEYVFPARNKRNEMGHVMDARGAKKKLCEAIGVKISNHDLRRTFSDVAQKKCGVPLLAVKMLCNHKLSGDVTLKHYTDSTDVTFLAPETEKISRWVVEQGKIAAAGNVISLDTRRAQ